WHRSRSPDSKTWHRSRSPDSKTWHRSRSPRRRAAPIKPKHGTWHPLALRNLGPLIEKPGTVLAVPIRNLTPWHLISFKPKPGTTALQALIS
ncbi:MAG TPA: hypothetical protein P5519_08010, partial [Spirochaetia bacterium]|nr:hypothetical protein [Spirochaetia bacterium]